MANDLTRESDRLLAESRALLRDNQAGGRHRRAYKQPIGRGSANPIAENTTEAGRQQNRRTDIKVILATN